MFNKKRPPSAADFLSCFEVLNTSASWASKIKNTVLSHVKSVPTLSFTKVSPRLPW